MHQSAEHHIRLAFLELGEEDRANLARLRPLLEKNADVFVAAFYRHLLSFEATRALLVDPQVKERLLRKQREYLLSLAGPTLDERFFAERIQIGNTHVRVGLEPRWYLGAYALYLRLLIPAICDQWPRDIGLAERIILSLHKVLMLDAQLAMESYIARREESLSFMNRELAETSRNLEHRVEVEQERVRVADERVRASEELASIATIVAGLAHEIGTPMGVIQGHAELLESSVSDERGRDRLRTIREQIDRIAGIIQTLLNIARPNSRELRPVDVSAVIRETLAFLAEKLRAHRIEVTAELNERAVLRGDHDKLQQLFINLILNAADAMPDGGKLRVSLVRAQPGKVEVQIADTGSGMSSDIAAHIFDPFFTTKPAGRGSGLGLVVVKGIVADHGGSISVTSAAGRGTCFAVTLPLPDDQSDASANSGA
jgi:signal transduction histidine kinase